MVARDAEKGPAHPMTFGSLFSGIGGIDLGFERAGMVCKWQCENDPYALKVLEKHWPAVPRYRDVRYFLGSKRWRRVRAAWHVDVIAGGFPCQDISNAGKRAGIDGERSGLWSEFARIVRLLQPRFVVVENVPALLGRGFGRVLGDLAECGLDAEWFCLPAASFGAPYLRERLFVVGRRAGNVANNDGLISGEKSGGLCAATSGRGWSGAGPANLGDYVSAQAVGVIDGKRLSKPEQERQFRGPIAKSDWWDIEPDLVRVVSGIPDRMDRIRGLGNAVCPPVSEWIGKRILQCEQ